MNRAISDALKTHAAALVFSPPMPIAWPNRDFTPPADGSRYITAAFVRADNERITLGAGTRYSGSLVLTVVTKVGAGTGEGESLADAVAAHFPQGLALPLNGGGHIRVTIQPTVRDGFLDAGMWRTPVVVPFAAMAE